MSIRAKFSWSAVRFHLNASPLLPPQASKLDNTPASLQSAPSHAAPAKLAAPPARVYNPTRPHQWTPYEDPSPAAKPTPALSAAAASRSPVHPQHSLDSRSSQLQRQEYQDHPTHHPHRPQQQQRQQPPQQLQQQEQQAAAQGGGVSLMQRLFQPLHGQTNLSEQQPDDAQTTKATSAISVPTVPSVTVQAAFYPPGVTTTDQVGASPVNPSGRDQVRQFVEGEDDKSPVRMSQQPRPTTIGGGQRSSSSGREGGGSRAVRELFGDVSPHQDAMDSMESLGQNKSHQPSSNVHVVQKPVTVQHLPPPQQRQQPPVQQRQQQSPQQRVDEVLRVDANLSKVGGAAVVSPPKPPLRSATTSPVAASPGDRSRRARIFSPESDRISALPPASQLDPGVMDALPLGLRRELERAYGKPLSGAQVFHP